MSLDHHNHNCLNKKGFSDTLESLFWIVLRARQHTSQLFSIFLVNYTRMFIQHSSSVLQFQQREMCPRNLDYTVILGLKF